MFWTWASKICTFFNILKGVFSNDVTQLGWWGFTILRHCSAREGVQEKHQFMWRHSWTVPKYISNHIFHQHLMVLTIIDWANHITLDKLKIFYHTILDFMDWIHSLCLGSTIQFWSLKFIVLKLSAVDIVLFDINFASPKFARAGMHS